jgi:alkylation response protein AidB-like acyl-CoA dehydrogenase
MELVLSSDQKLFRMTAKDFLEKEYPLSRVRRLNDEPPGFDRAWWQRAAELGWTAMLVPEELGGGSISEAGVRDLAVLAEELGAGVAPGALLPVNIVLAGLVEAHGTGADQTAVIDALVSGESIATWAVYEPGSEWAPHEPRVTATATSNGFLLEGVKDRVEAAGQADLVLVTAATSEGVGQFLVPTNAPGVSVSEQWSLDLARTFGEVRLDAVPVGPEALVGTLNADRQIERQLQIAVLLQCAEVCGGLDRMFATTVQWAFDRFTFGRPLASYQALKHRFADMRTWLEACQATTAAAAVAVQEHSEEAAELVSVAKSYVGERSLKMLQDYVQIHGGIGVTWEHDLHLYLRRATVNQSLYGTPADHRRRLTDLASF